MPKQPKATTSLQELADKGVKKVKVTKANEYVPTKGKATHNVVVSPGSVLVDPVKKWPKHKGGPTAAYGPPRIADEQPSTAAAWHPPIPDGATHAEYSNSNLTGGTVSIACEIKFLEDFRTLRGGRIRFGRLRYDDTFVSMMPDDQGDTSKPLVRENPLPPPVAKTGQGQAFVGAKPAPKPKKAVGPQPGDQPGLRQNGVTKPKAGATAQVWSILDACKGDKAQAAAQAKAANINPSTFAVQSSAWRKFHAV